MSGNDSERSPLKGSLLQLAGMLQSAVDAIISIDAAGTVESINPATERLFGYSSDELVGQNVKMLMPEPYRGQHDGYIRHYRETGQHKIIGSGREVLGRRKDGSTFTMHLSVSVDRSEIENAVLNLAINARDAMKAFGPMLQVPSLAAI
ncbi:PAS domain S-box protein [Hyphomicrobium sp. MC1]|uniref:PAS domain S-box protein n=1 Tax=Hyphomicrobium sp. (strain MC1) TaxID=717785 RepID=UPI000213E452|nr:PAS domain S-box protein [Hyphomicrobium sp. MC1]CCB66504.1 protein of unknown function [Hyphomicrobium sp. MC1]